MLRRQPPPPGDFVGGVPAHAVVKAAPLGVGRVQFAVGKLAGASTGRPRAASFGRGAKRKDAKTRGRKGKAGGQPRNTRNTRRKAIGDDAKILAAWRATNTFNRRWTGRCFTAKNARSAKKDALIFNHGWH